MHCGAFWAAQAAVHDPEQPQHIQPIAPERPASPASRRHHHRRRPSARLGTTGRPAHLRTMSLSGLFNPPEQAGYLLKLGHGRKSLKERFFVLKVRGWRGGRGGEGTEDPVGQETANSFET